MGDFIELGLEGCDKLIDKHFDKLPDHYTDPKTYKHPQKSRKERQQQEGQGRGQRRRGQSVGDERDYYQEQRRDSDRRRRSPSPSSDYPPEMYATNNGRPRGDANSSPYLQDGPFISPPFSTMPAVQRPEYSPSNVDRGRDRDYYQPPPTQSGGRPSQQMRRRSSSYHGPRQTERFYSSEDDSADERSRRGGRSNQQLATRERGRDHSRKSENGHHNLKDEVASQFTKSKDGLAGGALGALVGGWATHKALETKGRGGSDADKAWTLLGAAVGGLAVNSIVDKWEDNRNDRREKGRIARGKNERERERREYDSEEEERRYRR